MGMKADGGKRHPLSRAAAAAKGGWNSDAGCRSRRRGAIAAKQEFIFVLLVPSRKQESSTQCGRRGGYSPASATPKPTGKI
jgi:hypothetical protein